MSAYVSVAFAANCRIPPPASDSMKTCVRAAPHARGDQRLGVNEPPALPQD